MSAAMRGAHGGGATPPCTATAAASGQQRRRRPSSALWSLLLPLLFSLCLLAAVPAFAQPCETGQYVNGTACADCPAGSYCPDKTTATVLPCDAGSFSPANATSCTDCSTGQYALGGATACTDCPAGTTNNVAHDDCPACDAGTACPGGVAAVACADGTYSLGNAAACTDCPAGSFCPAKNTLPQVCATGQYALGNATACTDCPAGSFCPVNDAPPQGCATGQYSLGNATACTDCPAGQFCPVKTAMPQDCGTGQYALGSATACTDCPAGSACAVTTAGPVACTPGSMAIGLNNTACTPCAAGFQCPSTSSGPVPCLDGFRSTGNATACTVCLPGTTNNVNRDSCENCDVGTACPGSQAAIVCGPGTYALNGSDRCRQCEAGFACASRTETPTPCDAGWFAVAGDAVCSPCPVGSWSGPSSANCTACVTGTYANVAQSSSCLECPAGSHCSNPAALPHLCPSGTFSKENAALCTSCPSGTWSLGGQPDDCLPCPLGHACANSTLSPVQCLVGTFSSAANSSVCPPCPAGYTSKAAGASGCVICEAGEACPGGALPTDCVLPTYALEGASACTQCPAGHRCPSASAAPDACDAGWFAVAGDAVCSPCPVGSWSGPSSANCTACVTGTYAAVANSSSCTPCPAGKFCADTTQAPAECLAGEFSLQGSVMCTTCALGTYAAVTQSTSCLECPAGSHCFNPAALPHLCPNGTFSKENAETCTDCPIGTWSPGGQPNGCLPCPLGHACADSTLSPVECTIGYFNSAANSTACSVCPAGFTSLNGASGCVACAAGKQCPGSGQAPLDCVAGFYSLGGASACTECPAGSHCPVTDASPIACVAGTFAAAGATNCTACPLGTSCTANGTTTLCAAGQYSSTGLCIDCPKGFYCSSTQVSAPLLCPAGTYALLNSAQCLPCPAGQMCPVTTALPTPCDAGQYALDNSTACTDCPPGYSCLIRSSMPVACAPGTFAQGTLNQACLPCPAGSACPSTTQKPQDCPVGFHSGINATACTPCPPGSLCTVTAGPTTPCAPGQYNAGAAYGCETCPEGSQCPYTTENLVQPCPAGYYSLGGQQNCTVCPAGSACPAKNVSPTPCSLAVSYSIGAQTACTPCPLGFVCDLTSARQCPLGFFALAGATTCSVCPAGSACPTTSTKHSCIMGTYSLGGNTTCAPCPVGTECLNAAVAPTPCALGSYRTDMTTNECIECPPGFRCPSRERDPEPCPEGWFSLGNADECTICPAGSACPSTSLTFSGCPVNTFSGQGLQACELCTAGFECAANTQNFPTVPCRKGFYCPRGMDRVPCPAGSYRDTTGGQVLEDCLPCDAGSACPAGSTSSSEVPCADGHICPTGTPSATSFPCLPGTYRPLLHLQRVSRADCLICPEGSYCELAEFLPKACNRGTYCPQGSVSAQATPCPLGKWSDVLGVTNHTFCQDCTAGHYCPYGAALPVPCPPGSYNPDSNSYLASNCRPCDGGRSCSTFGLPAPNGDCAAGHYCPEGTINPIDTACPAGSFNNITDGFKLASCAPCPAGMACPRGSAGQGCTIDDQVACAPGHFCPEGTGSAKQHACPAGTFTAATNLTAAAECTKCPPGSFCAGGEGVVSGPCDPGHYCPENTTHPRQFPCPAGFYLNATGGVSQASCADCPAGSFCPQASADPIPCSKGTFNDRIRATADGMVTSSLQVTAFPNCTSCTAGSYCATPGLPWPTAQCPEGTYAPAGASACLSCPAGYYCDAEGTTQVGVNAPKQCPQGYHCAAGQSAGNVNQCAAGYYCPAGSAAAVSCPLGTYNDLTGRFLASDCVPCPAGLFCGERVASALGSGLCAPGHYCPAGSSTMYQSPCPAGFNRSSPGATAAVDCGHCPPGRYCPPGSDVGVLCPMGFYCPPGQVAPRPCPLGTYGNATGLESLEACWACDGGSYCDQDGLTFPAGKCDPGFFCISGATSSQPKSGEQGGACPAGGYCPQGSAFSLPCPAGRYQNVSGASDITLCQKCPPGHYCASTSNAGPTGPCRAGFYCDGSADSPIQHATPAGYYTETGSSAPTPCAVGRYAPSANSTACLECDAGFFCPNQTAIFLTPCPPGSFCVAGSSDSAKCQPGTYNPLAQSRNESACLPCPAGQYCAGLGAVAPTDECDEGFYCQGGSKMSRPISLDMGGFPCPKGYYCPLGTQSPQACLAGTYSDNVGLSDQDDCLPCPPGQYCLQNNVIAVGAGPVAWIPDTHNMPVNCDGGYYCTGSAVTASPSPLGPTGGPCSAGFYCPPGSVAQLPCPAGNYTGTGSRASCDECPAGSWCELQTSSPTLCEKGYYCPPGTAYRTQFPCPLGTYGLDNGAPSYELGCRPCTPGKYCDSLHATTPAGLCRAGFYCPTAASDAFGTKNVTASAATSCPRGHFCPEGIANPLPCPSGTFLNATGGTALSSCFLCTPGHYCGSAGLTAPTGNCSAGHYCLQNSSIPTPQSNALAGIDAPTAGGDACPVGHRCPIGSVQPLPCSAGTFQNLTAQPACQTCPAGYYCDAASIQPLPCPLGYWCGSSTGSFDQNPCPAGTFQNQSRRTSSADCRPCTPGSYCEVASPHPTGLCQSGYWCNGSDTSATPRQCGLGNYCPTGSPAPIPCPENYACNGGALATYTDTCAPGYFCAKGATTTAPGTLSSQGGPCPAGKWCPGNAQPVACANGTFNPMALSQSIAACVNCTAGRVCPSSGMAAAGASCPAGYYCPAGTGVASLLCPRGSSCPEGSIAPVECEAGTFQNATAKAACITCPAGYFCPPNTADPAPCPAGSYCLAGTRLADEFPCPTGFYNNKTHATSAGYCAPCAGGYYCANNGSTTPQGSGPCAAGYFCEGGSNTPTPSLLVVVWNGRNYTNDRCLAGSYCTQGSSRSTICPLGYFAVGRGNTDLDSCKPCPRGQYCAAAGASSSAGTFCDAGFLCVGGATTAQPFDNTTGYPCPAGTFCEAAALNFTLCAPGTFNPSTGQSACKPCLPGYYCSDHGQVAGYPCPLGSFCPAGTAQPQGCPVGSLGSSMGLSAVSNCTLCPPGRYCAMTNLTASTGPCAAGFFCDVGSASSHPTGPGPLPGAGPNGGPCPAGHYCPLGIGAPQPCPAGTFLAANQSASSVGECRPCTAGQYCGAQGLPAPSGACAAGYFCPTGSNSSTAVACPAGKYCVTPFVDPQPCSNGTYTNATQRSQCSPCPARYYCVNSETVPLPCPSQSYCPEGTGQPLTCPAGFYSTVGSLAAASECAACPPGKYCTNGVVQGNCSAGYMCWSGSASPQPLGGNVTAGGPCPAGHWCASGTAAPTPCEADFLRREVGGAQLTDCLGCPLGYACLRGNPVPIPCQAGYFCLADGRNVPCPAGTYNGLVAQTNISACLTCPAGYRCAVEGLSDPTRFPCQPGSYCPANQVNASSCPAGTWNPRPLAQKVEDCASCSGGFICPAGSASETPCAGGTFCPRNSSFPRPCPAQYYCPVQSAAPLPCPGGWYCPANSSAPLYCDLGMYCDPLSAAPLYCPSGFISLSVENRTSLNSSCAACPVGYYSAAGSALNCTLCDGGYVCTGAANTPSPTTPAQGGYECPIGFFCPPGVSVEQPCPPGSYNALSGQGSLASCLLCAANSFQDLAGSAGCKPCTASSGAPPGSASCACQGANRAFQASDQSCICQPGFEFISDSHRLSEEDDVVDCQPIILDRCAAGKARDSRGKCVDSLGADCPATQCNGSPGKFSVPLGVCECIGQPLLDTVCGAECRKAAPKLSFANDRLTVTDPSLQGIPGVNASYSVALSSVPGFIGAPDCRAASCNFYAVVVNGGVGGIYGPPAVLLDHAVSAGIVTLGHAQRQRAYTTMAMSSPPKLDASLDSDPASASSSPSRRAMRTQANTLYDGTSHVLNPSVICLVSGEGLLFDVSAASSGHYPVYLKDNLLNSNPAFDWGYFRNLSTAVASNSSGVRMFAFTFHVPGVYVFADQAAPQQISIVRVVSLEQVCPTPNGDPLARMQPFIFEALISNGVQRNQNIVITPDWTLLGIMIALIAVLVGLIVVGLYFFQTHSWGSGAPTVPRYKLLALQDSLDVWNLFSKGTLRSVDNVSKGLTSLASPAAQEALALASVAQPKGAQRAAAAADLDGDGLGSDGLPAGSDMDAAPGTSSDGGGGVDALGGLMSSWEGGDLDSGDPNDSLMNELSSHLDLEGFDFHSLYKMLDETKASVEGYFEHQEDGLRVFYERMASEIDHLKNVLAVKMQVQLHKTGEGLSEAVDRLVSGELLARQAFQDLSRRRELELTRTLEQLVTSIRNLTDDYNLFPIKELVRLTNEHILYCERGLEQERNRRKIFASHTEIVGRPILDALSKADLAEEGIQNGYMDALKMFEAAVVELLRKMLNEEQLHAAAMEKLDESSTEKRQLELDRFRLGVCKLTKEVQQQLSYLDENLTPIFESLREMEDKTHHVWVHIQGELLEQRWAALLHPTEGRLFRGINPELAKVLTGLLGMRGGLTVDPVTGTFQPKDPYDASDPFDTIHDYQAQAEAERERAELEEDSDYDGEEEGGRRRRKKGKNTDGTSDEDEEGTGTVARTKKRRGSDADSDAEAGTGERRRRGGRKDGEDGGASDDETGTKRRGDGGEDDDEDDLPTGAPNSSEEVRALALADLKKKRRGVEDDESLSEEERAARLAALDAELETLRKVFGDSEQQLLDEFDRSQRGRIDEIADEEAAIARLKAELLAKHAELAALEETHDAEEAALIKQLDREDAEVADSFAVDMSKFDMLLEELREESAGGAGASAGLASKRTRRKKAQLEDGSYDEGEAEDVDEDADCAEYREASSTLLNEFEFVINDMRNQGASDAQIRERVTEMHAQKRQQLREKRMGALKKKQEAEAEAVRVAEEQTKEMLQLQIKDQAELALVMDALKLNDGKSGGGEPGAGGADGSSGSGAAGSSSSSSGGVGGVGGVDGSDVPMDPAMAAEYEKNREAIERRYKRAQLEREARNAVSEAFEYAKLEFRQELMLHNRLRAKQLALASGGEEGKQTEEELRELLAGADADRAQLESAQDAEKARQRRALQERLAAQKKAQADRVGKKKELELRAEARKVEEANKDALRTKEKHKIHEALFKVEEPSRRKLGKKVIELVMNPRHAREVELLLGDHLEERMAFVAEQMEAAQLAGLPVNFVTIEQEASLRFDEPHARQVADLVAKQRGEVRQAFLELYPDEEFLSEEWAVPETDPVAEYQRRRRELTSKNAAASRAAGGEGDGASGTDDAIRALSEETVAKQRAHEARLRAEQEELDKMQRDFDAKEAARKAKRAALEEEQKKRELDLLDDLSDAQRADILNQHRLNLKNFERAVDNERAKQASLLEKSLEERRRKLAILKAKRKAQLEKEKLLEKQQLKRLKKKMIKKLKDESVGAAGDLWKMRAAMAGGAGGSVLGLHAAGMGLGDVDEGDDGGNDSDDGVSRHQKRVAREENERKELAEKQEVLQRLRTIESMVDKIQSQTDAWRGQIYIDAKDASDPAYQPRGTSVVVAGVADLDAKALVLYRFGVNLAQVLFARGVVRAPVNGISNRAANTPVHMLIASSLPPNLHAQTAFRNSFHYDSERGVLYLRKERLQDVGEFLLLLCHCLAHIATSACNPHAGVQPNTAVIAAGTAASSSSGASAPNVGVVEGWDDRNPTFVAAFHQCLKFICADIFYVNASKALQAAPHVLPLVQPMSSTPLLLPATAAEGEGQVEGAAASASASSSSSSSSAAAASASPSVEGLSAEENAAWLGPTVRNMAIDELLSLHPLSSLDGAGPTGSTIGGAASLHHSSGWGTARMLERLGEYHAFAHATSLKQSLTELEKSSRQREHARELTEARSFRQRAVRGVPPPTPADDKSWQMSGARPGQVQGLSQLRDIEDELTAELSTVAEQLYQHTHRLHQAERDARDLRTKANPTAADQAALAKLDAAMQSDKALIAQLNRHKDNAIYRLRNVHATTEQMEGGADDDQTTNDSDE